MQDKTQEKSSICTATVTQEGPAKWNVAFEWKDGTFCVPGEYKLYAHPQQAAPAAVAVPDAVRDAEKLLREEAARLERIYGTNKWYGFSAEKDSHIGHLRVAAALAATPAADAQWLQPRDLEALQRFEETASDNQGHDIGKAAVARLAGFGCLQNHGFGQYSITAFGNYVLNNWSLARDLPFKMQAERDAEHRAAIAAAKGE